MIATNKIKINGVWYYAGDELPDDRTPTLKSVLSEDVGKPIEENKASMTRAEVEEMKFFALKSLAEKNGIKTEGKKAPVIKKEVIEALGL